VEQIGFSLEWKREGVVDGECGCDEEDKLACVMG